MMLSEHLKRVHESKIDGSRQSLMLLPPAISGMTSTGDSDSLVPRNLTSLLCKREAAITKDWKVVSKTCPSAEFEQYRYFWLIVNSRSFFYDVPQDPEPQSHGDKMVLCPYLDYLNHADEGVSRLAHHVCLADRQLRVQYNEDGFSITTDRPYGMYEHRAWYQESNR